MITKIQGVLDSLVHDRAAVSPGQGLTYEVLLPPFASARLAGSVGQVVTLQTLHYLEGSSQSGNLTPRLAGFLDVTDREFFQLFTTVKGIGSRKGLRAMAMSSARIAAAIEDRDTKTIQSLPEIGRRMAETVVATLHGKVERFLSAGSLGTGEGGGGDSPRPPEVAAAREALEVLIQLGENRIAAIQWIEKVMEKQPELADATRIVQEALRRKGG